METVFIKFLNDDDRKRGFYELARRSKISSLPNAVYQVPFDGLALLDAKQIPYRRATDEEVKGAHDQVRNPSPVIS